MIPHQVWNFFDELGLLNNLDGTWTDKAKIDSEQWMQKMQDIKNQQNVQLNAQDQKKQDLTSEEGQAKIFYNALVDLCSRSKMEKGWDNTNEFVGDNSIINLLFQTKYTVKPYRYSCKMFDELNKYIKTNYVLDQYKDDWCLYKRKKI